MTKKKMRSFNITCDAKFSYDFYDIRAIDVRTAKKKAIEKFKRKMNLRSVSCYDEENKE